MLAGSFVDRDEMKAMSQGLRESKDCLGSRERHKGLVGRVVANGAGPERSVSERAPRECSLV